MMTNNNVLGHDMADLYPDLNLKCSPTCENKKEYKVDKVQIRGVVLLELTCVRCNLLLYACSKCGKYKRTESNKSAVVNHVKSGCKLADQPPDERRGCQEQNKADQDNDRQLEARQPSQDQQIRSTSDDSPQLKRLRLLQHFEQCFSPEAVEYFMNEFDEMGSGINHMASRAIFGDTHGQIFNKLMAHYHAECTVLAASMTREQLNLLSSCMYNSLLLAFHTNFDAFLPLANVSDTRRCYLDGSNSMLRSAPVPRVEDRDVNGFVHVVMQDCANLLMAQKKKLETLRWSVVSDWKNDADGEWHTPWHKETYEKIEGMDPPHDLRVHIYYLWSDSFQKNTLLQGKKTDIQVFTAYFVPPKGERDLKTYTKPLAIGTKTKEHQETFEKILQECLELEVIKERWCARDRKMVPVIFKRRMVQNDLIERINNTQTMLIGSYHRRWGWSCEFISGIKSCKNCFLRRLKRVVCHKEEIEDFDIHCEQCGDWWAHNPEENEHCWFDCPADYPQHKHKDSPDAPEGRDILQKGQGKLRPVKLSYEFLLKAFYFAVHNYSWGAWNQKSFVEYLRTCCFSGGMIDALKKAIPTSRMCPDKIQPPSTWIRHKEFGLDFSQIVDTPMHMLFLGVTKHLLKTTRRLFRDQRLLKVYAGFSKVIDRYLKLLQSESISWCRGYGLSKEDSIDANVGWQSTHFVAFARLSLVYFGHMEDIHKQENLNKGGFNALKQMWVIFSCLLGALFGDGDGNADMVGDYARLFLSACSSFGERTTPEAMTGKQTKKRGQTKKQGRQKNKDAECFFNDTSNYFSILNLEDLVRRFGSMKNLWEGEREKYIKFLKAFLISILDTETYFSHILRKMLRSHFFDDIMEDSSTYNPTRYTKTQEYRVYKSVAIFKKAYWDKGGIITAISIKGHDGIYICIQDKEDMVLLVPCQFLDSFGAMKLNLWYSPLAFSEDFLPSLKMSTDALADLVVDSYIIHPMVTPKGCYKKRNGHTVIGKSWKVRGKDGKFHALLPCIEDVFNELQEIVERSTRL